MDAEYSRRGLTSILKAYSLIFLLCVWMFLLINFRVLLPLVVSWLMCLGHDKSSEILTPMYLTVVVDWRVRTCSLFVIMQDGFFLFLLCG